MLSRQLAESYIPGHFRSLLPDSARIAQFVARDSSGYSAYNRRVRRSLLLIGIAAAVVGCSSDLGPAKDFKVMSLEDHAKSVSLADYKDKTVLLDFWATTCGPCKSSMPEIQDMWGKYHYRGFEVVSITAEDRDLVRKFHNATPFTYPVFLDETYQASMNYGVKLIPRFILIKKGKIVWDGEGYEQGAITQNVENAMN